MSFCSRICSFSAFVWFVSCRVSSRSFWVFVSAGVVFLFLFLCCGTFVVPKYMSLYVNVILRFSVFPRMLHPQFFVRMLKASWLFPMVSFVLGTPKLVILFPCVLLPRFMSLSFLSVLDSWQWYVRCFSSCLSRGELSPHPALGHMWHIVDGLFRLMHVSESSWRLFPPFYAPKVRWRELHFMSCVGLSCFSPGD